MYLPLVIDCLRCRCCVLAPRRSLFPRTAGEGQRLRRRRHWLRPPPRVHDEHTTPAILQGEHQISLVVYPRRECLLPGQSYRHVPNDSRSASWAREIVSTSGVRGRPLSLVSAIPFPPRGIRRGNRRSVTVLSSVFGQRRASKKRSSILECQVLGLF